MYEVKFTRSVQELVLQDFRSKITNREEWRLARAEDIELSTLEVWHEMIQTLTLFPLSYPEYNGYHLGIELYLPFVLVYKVEKNQVIVFDAIDRNKLFV